MEQKIESSCEIKSKVSSIDLSEQIRCRICLEDTGELLDLPCSCKRDLGKVHEQCYRKWIQTSMSSKLDEKLTETQCQVCKQKIGIKLKTKSQLKNCNEIKQSNTNSQAFCGVLSIGLIIYLLYLCVNAIVENSQTPYIIIFIVLGLAILFLLIILKVVITLTLKIFFKQCIQTLQFEAKPRESQRNIGSNINIQNNF